MMATTPHSKINHMLYNFKLDMHIKPPISIATIKDHSETIWANVVTADILATCVDMPSLRMIIGLWSSLSLKLYDITALHSK